jgi:serpin B
MIITNAIYFKASWHSPFRVRSTHDDTFYTLEDEKITVPMMKTNTGNKYLRGDVYQAIELLYSGYDFNMLVILPDKNKFTEFENCLDNNKLTSILEDMKFVKDIRLSMPKFEFKKSYGLAGNLEELGLTAAFKKSADFLGMTDTPGLFLTDVAQSTFLSVNEYETEAAAATFTTVFGYTPGPPRKYLDFVIDRPFIFLIRHFFTGTILFIGRVLNPLI